MQNLRKKFPVLNQCVYANTASAGLLSEDLMEWRQGHDLDYLIGGSEMKMKGFAHMPEIKKTVGKFFNCKPENVALVPNFSLGFNLLLEGLPNDKKVLLVNKDYPSVNWPFETRNFKRDYVDADEHMEENIYAKVKKGDVDILALSLVQWVDGVRIDFDFLKDLKKEFPNLIILADGTQYCGTEPFDFKNSGIDILGTSAYKWMLAGYGNGFFLVKDEVMDQFELRGIGNGSVDNDASKRNSITFCKFWSQAIWIPSILEVWNSPLNFWTKLVRKMCKYNCKNCPKRPCPSFLIFIFWNQPSSKESSIVLFSTLREMKNFSIN